MGLLEAFVELLFDIADDIARFGNWLRKNPIAGLGVLFLVVFFSWLTDRLLADSIIFTAAFWESNPEGIRNLVWAMATVFAGAAGLYGLYLAGRRTAALDRQAQVAHEHRVLAEQGQITERFTKAVEQLGHEEVAVRLGAIYALERVAKDSERDFTTITETLAAFVRERAPCLLRDASDDQGEDGSQFEDTTAPKIDVFAAVSVLARSIPRNSPSRTGHITGRVDLRKADLRGLDLPSANLAGFRFDQSDLSFATLADTDLAGASFRKSRCIATNFMSANISDATFAGALLDKASLDYIESRRANFRYARLLRATTSLSKFEDSDFGQAKLEGFDASVMEFNGCDFGGADFSSAFLSGATFVGCGLTNCSFDETELNRVVFSQCNLSNSVFGAAKFSDWDRTEGAVLSCEFRGSDLSSVDLSKSKGLSAEHLSGAFYRMGKKPPLLPMGLESMSLQRRG